MSRWVSALLVLVVVAGTVPAPVSRAADGPSDSGRFVDDDTSIFEADIEFIASLGVTFGCNPPVNDRFCPEDSVTRGAMAAFLTRLMDAELADSPGRFTDDDGSTFERENATLAEVGVTRGCNPPVNDRFCPEDEVTRGEMAAFFNRMLNLEPAPGPVFCDGDLTFNDYFCNTTSIFAADASALWWAELTDGCGQDISTDTANFCFDDPVTRGQMAAFIHRLFRLPDPLPPPPSGPAEPPSDDELPEPPTGLSTDQANLSPLGTIGRGAHMMNCVASPHSVNVQVPALTSNRTGWVYFRTYHVIGTTQSLRGAGYSPWYAQWITAGRSTIDSQWINTANGRKQNLGYVALGAGGPADSVVAGYYQMFTYSNGQLYDETGGWRLLTHNQKFWYGLPYLYCPWRSIN